MENLIENQQAQPSIATPPKHPKSFYIILAVLVLVLISLWAAILLKFDFSIGKEAKLKRADSEYFKAFINQDCEKAYDMLTTNAKQQANFNRFESVCKGEVVIQADIIAEKIKDIKFVSDTYATISSELTIKISAELTGDKESIQTRPASFNWIMEGSNWRLDSNMGMYGRDKDLEKKQADVVQKQKEARDEYDRLQMIAFRDGITYNGQYFSIKFPNTWENQNFWGGDAQYAPDEYFYTGSPSIELPGLDNDGNFMEKASSGGPVYRVTVTVQSAERFVKSLMGKLGPDFSEITPEIKQQLTSAISAGDTNKLFSLYHGRYVSGSDPFENPLRHFELFTQNGKQGIIGSDYGFGIFGKAIFLTGGKVLEIVFEDTMSHDQSLNIPKNFYEGIKDRLLGQILQGIVVK